MNGAGSKVRNMLPKATPVSLRAQPEQHERLPGFLLPSLSPNLWLARSLTLTLVPAGYGGFTPTQGTPEQQAAALRACVGIDPRTGEQEQQEVDDGEEVCRTAPTPADKSPQAFEQEIRTQTTSWCCMRR